MAERNFEPSPAEQFENEGLPGMDNLEEERRVKKGGPHKAKEGSVLPKKMVGTKGSISGFKYDYDNVAIAPVLDIEGQEFGEDHVINLVAAREEAEQKLKREKMLDDGKAVFVRKPDDSQEQTTDSQERGTRQFKNVADLLKFKEDRERAREKARQRYEQEQLKAAEAKKAPVKKKAK